MRYPVVIHKDVESVYGVTVPDLPGCFSAGDTLEEAVESAQEAIACHLEGLLMDGEPIPAKESLETHQASEDYKAGIWALVPIDISKLSSKTKRINITVPARVLAIVDEAAAREGGNTVWSAGSRRAQLRRTSVHGAIGCGLSVQQRGYFHHSPSNSTRKRRQCWRCARTCTSPRRQKNPRYQGPELCTGSA